jgi:hypothetical protein
MFMALFACFLLVTVSCELPIPTCRLRAVTQKLYFRFGDAIKNQDVGGLIIY